MYCRSWGSLVTEVGVSCSALMFELLRAAKIFSNPRYCEPRHVQAQKSRNSVVEAACGWK